MHGSRRRNRHSVARQRRSGFTLLEVLLTAMLSATLMMGLWGLFGTYLKLFETGQSRVERSQLVRALTRQISDDLHSLVPPPLHNAGTRSSSRSESAPGTSALDSADSFATTGQSAFSEEMGAAPHFVLAGNERTLRIEMLQAVPLFEQQVLSERPTDGPFAVHPPRAAELRVVLYSFEPPREVSPSDREPPPGFIRRASTWEETQSSVNGFGAGAAALLSADDGELSRGFPALSSVDLVDAETTDDSLIRTREVVAFRFRYFDGREWLNAWDSRERKALPAAVEVAFRLDSTDKKKQRRSTADKANRRKRSDDDSTERDRLTDFDDFDETGLDSRDTHGSLYRHVIALHASTVGPSVDEPAPVTAFP